MNLTARDRQAIVLGASALAVLLVGYFLLLPWLEDWGRARQSAPADRACLSDLEGKIVKLLAQRQRLAERYGPAAARPLENVEKTRLAFLQAVQGAVRNGGLQDPACQPQPPKAAPGLPGVQLLPLLVTGKTQTPQLARCLEELRKTECLVLIDQVSVTGNDKQPGQLAVSLTLVTLAAGERAGS